MFDQYEDSKACAMFLRNLRYWEMCRASISLHIFTKSLSVTRILTNVFADFCTTIMILGGFEPSSPPLFNMIGFSAKNLLLSYSPQDG